MRASEERVRRAVVEFLAREIDEQALRERGWEPGVGTVRWYAAYAGGHRDQPYRAQGPAGSFTRYRGDHAEALYRLDEGGGWALDSAAGEWVGDDAPVRRYELARLSPEEVDALYQLDDWGGWYFDYAVGSWELAEAPRASYYLAELEIHEVDAAEAAKVAAALGAGNAVTAETFS